MRHLALALTAAALLHPALASAEPAGLQETLRRAQPAVHRCVERSIRAGEDPGRRAEVVARIAPTGRVTEARLAGGDAHPRFARCVEATVERLRFPSRREPVTVRFPLWMR